MFIWHWASSFIWRPNCLVLSLKSGKEGEGVCSNIVSAQNNEKHLQTYRLIVSLLQRGFPNKSPTTFSGNFFILVLSSKSGRRGREDCSNIVSKQWETFTDIPFSCITSSKRFSKWISHAFFWELQPLFWVSQSLSMSLEHHELSRIYVNMGVGGFQLCFSWMH